MNDNSCKCSFFVLKLHSLSLAKRIIFFISIQILCMQMAHAQQYLLQIKGSDTASFTKITRIQTTYPSFLACKDALQEARNVLLQNGYLGASVDSLIWHENYAEAYIVLGKKYVWANIKNKNIPPAILAQSRFEEKKYFGQTINYKKIAPVFEKIIRYFEDNGYPFASVYLDSIQIKQDSVFALLACNKESLTKIDTIIIDGDAKISKSYLLQYLGLKEHALYDESKLKKISTRLRELPFLAEANPWRLDFQVAHTSLHLFVKNKVANKADVLIGLLPNNTEIGSKFLVTGDIKLGFQNVLGQGEEIALNWQNLQYKSPRYNVLFVYPYLFNSPIGISSKFDYYKKDSTFKTTNGELGLVYLFSANEQVKLFYQLAKTEQITVDKASLIARRALPVNADISSKSFGIEGSVQRVDYKFNPRKGYQCKINASLSIRNFIKNATIENTYDPVAAKVFAYLYDSIALKSYKYTITAQFKYYLPLTKRIVLSSTYHGGIMYSSQSLFKNEIFQIGGYRLMRGFDEGSLFVKNYHVFTLEPHYLLSLNSYFFLFGDVANMQIKYSTAEQHTFLYSTGIGMSFETKGGLFNISYAFGAQGNQGIRLKNSKIHFGYVSYF